MGRRRLPPRTAAILTLEGRYVSSAGEVWRVFRKMGFIFAARRERDGLVEYFWPCGRCSGMAGFAVPGLSLERTATPADPAPPTPVAPISAVGATAPLSRSELPERAPEAQASPVSDVRPVAGVASSEEKVAAIEFGEERRR